MNALKSFLVICFLTCMVCYCPKMAVNVEAEEIVGETATSAPAENVTTPSAENTTSENAVDGYIVTVENNTLRCTYLGNAQKKIYLAVINKNGNYTVVSPKIKGALIYYFNANGVGTKYTKTKIISITFQKKSAKYYVKSGKLGTGWYTKKRKKYYYSSGEMVTGWQKIKGKRYYFSKKKKTKGQLITNTIIQTKKKSYYVDSTGVRVTSKDVKAAVKYVTAHTKKKWSNSKKLKACYDYLCKHSSYQRFYGIPTASDMKECGTYMLTKRRGNCYRYAAAFAYIAKVLGYESRVAVGKITSINGGMTPHGWTEVKVNGKWRICDADMQSESNGVDSYMKTEATYKYRHTCSDRYTIKIKNGKVTWK